MEEHTFKDTLRQSAEVGGHGQVVDGILEQLDMAVAEARQSGDLVEEAFVVRMQAMGPSCDGVLQMCAELSQSYNTLAMRKVEEDAFDDAYELLKKAEILTEEEGCLKGWRPLREKLLAVTLNNLGCFFKRRGRLQAALHYLMSAAVVEAASDAAENPAGTMLNLCAVLSQLGRHTEALEHAVRAVGLLTDDANRNLSPTAAAANASFQAIAFHNQAVELEFLGRATEARSSYAKACQLADQCWGADSPMAVALRTSLRAFSKTTRATSAQSSAAASSRAAAAKRRTPSARSTRTELRSAGERPFQPPPRLSKPPIAPATAVTGPSSAAVALAAIRDPNNENAIGSDAKTDHTIPPGLPKRRQPRAASAAAACPTPARPPSAAAKAVPTWTVHSKAVQYPRPKSARIAEEATSADHSAPLKLRTYSTAAALHVYSVSPMPSPPPSAAVKSPGRRRPASARPAALNSPSAIAKAAATAAVLSYRSRPSSAASSHLSPNPTSRPTSTRPTSGRPTSARPTSARHLAMTVTPLWAVPTESFPSSPYEVSPHSTQPHMPLQSPAAVEHVDVVARPSSASRPSRSRPTSARPSRPTSAAALAHAAFQQQHQQIPPPAHREPYSNAVESTYAPVEAQWSETDRNGLRDSLLNMDLDDRLMTSLRLSRGGRRNSLREVDEGTEAMGGDELYDDDDWEQDVGDDDEQKLYDEDGFEDEEIASLPMEVSPDRGWSDPQAQEERWVLTQKQRESSQSPRAEMLQPMEERAVYQPGAARKTVVRPVESAERRGRSAHSARRPGH